LSSYIDLTAFSLVWPLGQDRYYLKAWAWIPEQTLLMHEKRDKVLYGLWKDQGWLRTCPGDVMDPQWLAGELKGLIEQYRPQQVLWDRYGARYLIQDLQSAGIPMFEFGQGTTSMSQPTKEFQRLVLAKQLLHDGNPVLSYCVGNVALEVTGTELVKPSKKNSYRGRIDMAVSSIMALAGAMEKTVSVYETRGLFV
jgi:phage terminase large subunit-like protein